MIKTYELVLLARPDASDEDIKMALQTLKDIIVSNNNSVVYAEYWGLRDLAYKINKNSAAHYYMLQFTSTEDVNNMLREKLATSEIFIRNLFTVCKQDEVKMRTPNANVSSEDDGIVMDRRYLDVVNAVYSK